MYVRKINHFRGQYMKNTKLLFTLFVCFSLFLAACGKTSTSQSQDGSKEKVDEKGSGAPVNTVIIGGRVGGSWSVFSEGIAESIRKTNKGSVITVEPGGLVENAPLVGENKIPFGLAYSMTAFAAYTGTEPYKTKYEDLRAVSVVIPSNLYQFVARADAPFDSFDEMVSKKIPARIVVDDRGAPGEIITRGILEAYGVSYDEIKAWGGSVDHLGNSKSFELMSDGRADGTGDAIPVPDSSILEAAATNDLKLIPIGEDVIKKLEDSLGIIRGTVSSGSYDFQKEDILTVNTPAILITNKNVEDEVVYQVVKSIYENFGYLGTVHEEFKQLTKENLANVGGLPIHPGAEKFYQEMGITIVK
jgi:uncharacterized protein